jgi:ferredoxin
MKTLYYTATGNSLYAAKRIGGETLSIPKLLQEGRLKLEDDAIGLVFPCHTLGVPRLVEEFLAKATLKAGYFFAVMTYGNMGASGLAYIKKSAGKAGITFDYTNEVLMVDNYLPIFDINDQLAKEGKKGIEAKLAAVTADIAARRRAQLNKNPATNALGRLVHAGFAGRSHDEADRKFLLNQACNGCGTCARVCPRGNIAMQEGKPCFLHHCDSCYACIHNCPQNALHLKSEKSAARFRNAHVQLGEIIAANDRTMPA